MLKQSLNQDQQDDDRGIDAPVPDQPSGGRSVEDDGPAEYPLASRFAAAANANYRSWRSSSPRQIELIVIHITDGGAKIEGTIGY